MSTLLSHDAGARNPAWPLPGIGADAGATGRHAAPASTFRSEHRVQRARTERRLNVLVVDDDPAQCRLLASALLHCGAGEVVQATGGARALALLAEGASFDLLITDLRMAGMDGIELLHHAARYPVPALALASSLDQQLLDAAVAIGRGRGYRLLGALRKPLDLAAIGDLLAAARNAQLPAASVGPVHLPAPARPWRSSELRCALDQGQFVPFFQPKIDMATGAPTGVEVLARWHHPRFGMIAPDRFIGIMEKSGLIQRLTESILGQALSCARQWDEAGPALGLALNVAPQTLGDAAMPNRLMQMVREAGVAPERVTIEVTETGIATSGNALLEGVTRLRVFGFPVAVDDFGMGQSTLQQLSKLPFTELKLDRYFVSGAGDSGKRLTILESIMSMAGKLGLEMVGEGVETAGQRDFLLERGCSTGQGYLFARPMQQDALCAWLSEHRAAA